MTIRVYTYRFTSPGPSFDIPVSERFTWGEIEATTADLKDYPFRHEVLGVIVYIDHRLTHGATASFKFYNDDTGELLAEVSASRPDPSSEGFDWWDWQKFKSMIGHVDFEINGPMLVRIETDVEGEHYTRTMQVIHTLPPTPPPEGFETTDPTYRSGSITINTIPYDFQYVGFTIKDANYSGYSKLLITPEGFDVVKDSSTQEVFVFLGFDSGNGRWDISIYKERPTPPIEPPANFIELLKGLLTDIFFEGLTVQAALTKWNILPQWVGNIIENIINLFSINIAPEGEKAIRVILPGGGVALKTVAGISEAAAVKLSAELVESSASKIVALATRNPAGVRAALKLMTEETLEKLFATLSKSATGRIAIVKLMNTIGKDFAAKAFNVFGLQVPVGKALTITGFFFAFLYLAKFVGFDLPGYLAIFRKEIPEPSSMAVWALIEAAQTVKTPESWQAAQAGNEKFKSFIELADKETAGFVSLNPWLKDIYLSSSDAQRAQYEGYVSVINDGLAGVEPPTGEGALLVSSTPTNAKIYIDNEYKFEVTNTTITLAAGNYLLTLKKSGYLDQSKSITINAFQTRAEHMTLVEDGVEPPEPTPTPPGVPEEIITIPLEPGAGKFNAWKVTIKGVDAETGAELAAWILINDAFLGKTTPWFVYLLPSSTYNIKLRLSGYRQGEVTFTTEALPIE